MGRLDDKVAIITGSGRGIGQAMALLFAQEGAKVVVNDIDEDVALKVKEEIEKQGGKAAVCVASVVNPKEAEKIVKTAIDSFGKLDILVNNAGTTRDAVIHKTTDEQWDLILNLCLRGPFNMIRAAAPYMREPAKKEKEKQIVYHRKIVNLSSIAGISGNAGQANYASAKSGVIGLTKTIAREWGRFNINCNCVAPGYVDTRLTQPKKEGSSFGLPEGTAEMAKMMIPLERIGQPEDIAKACLFLCSNDSDWITGQVLNVNGGVI